MRRIPRFALFHITPLWGKQGKQYIPAHNTESGISLLYDKDPSLFRGEVLAQPRGRWIVVDEVQRVPKLLDEVHFLMEEKGYRKFALTGSSVRKLKRVAANLLAGRAVVKQMFPLTTREMQFSAPVAQPLRFGAMPLSVTAQDDERSYKPCRLMGDLSPWFRQPRSISAETFRTNPATRGYDCIQHYRYARSDSFFIVADGSHRPSGFRLDPRFELAADSTDLICSIR